MLTNLQIRFRINKSCSSIEKNSVIAAIHVGLRLRIRGVDCSGHLVDSRNNRSRELSPEINFSNHIVKSQNARPFLVIRSKYFVGLKRSTCLGQSLSIKSCYNPGANPTKLSFFRFSDFGC